MLPDWREEVEEVSWSLLLQFIIEETHQVRLPVNIDLREKTRQELQHRVHPSVESDLSEVGQDVLLVLLLLPLRRQQPVNLRPQQYLDTRL